MSRPATRPTSRDHEVGEKVTDPAQLGPAGWRFALDWLDLRWPPGNPAALREMADAWTACGRALAACETDATAAASMVWNPPGGTRPADGDVIEGFKLWWHSGASHPVAAPGPHVNLLRGSESAIRVGVALYGLATEIEVTRAFWVAKLGALVGAAVAIGAVLVATGGLGGFLLASAGAGVAVATRRVLIRAVTEAVQRIAAKLITPLLLAALATFTAIAFRRFAETDVDTRARTETRTEPDPREQPKPVPPPPGEWWRRNRRPSCALPPRAQETPQARITGGADPVYVGKRIWSIDRHIGPDGSRTVTIDGFLGTPIPRQQFERQLPGLAESVGLSPRLWQRAHAWPPVWGSEVREGIFLATTEMNTAQRVLEDQIRGMYERLPSKDSWIEVSVKATTHPSPDFDGTGANVLHHVEYDARICNAKVGVIEELRVGLESRPPGQEPHAYVPSP